MGHIHSVYDTDTHFKIDATTRVVKNSPETKVMIVQHDHNSERFTFEIPRHVDGHDMATCNVVQVHYINTDATGKGVYTKGIYEVDDLQISPDDENVVICSWLISGNATKYVGKLSFIIRFACTTGEVVDYAWNTAIHSNVHISSGINNGDEMVEEYADILEQWREELFNGSGGNAVIPDALPNPHALTINGQSYDGSEAVNVTTENGKDGSDGVSPVVAVSAITGGHRITITDKNGAKTVDVMDGEDGQNGANGKDGNGIKSVILNADYTLTLTFDNGTSYTTPSIRGATGATGRDGKDGSNGSNGKDGTSVTVKSVTESTADGGSNVVEFSDGKTLTVKNGRNGTNGTSVTVSNVSESTASGGTNVVTFSDGKTVNIKNGKDGKNGSDATVTAESIQNALGYIPVGAGTNSPLTGTKIVYDGDSICAAAFSYPKLIADKTACIYENQAVGGGRLCSYSGAHSVVDNLPNLPKDGDLYCFQGGINDFWANTPVGTYNRGDYTGTVDPATIYGALETIFRYALTNFFGRAICFVITHKIKNTMYWSNTEGKTFWDYREAMINVCEKYSIPYYDSFAESGLNGWHTGHAAGLFVNGDGIHPTETAYEAYYVPQLIRLFESVVPVGDYEAPAKPVTYTNALKEAVGSDGQPYNGGKGWKADTYLSYDGRTESSSTNYDVTGFIPAKIGDIIRLKNVQLCKAVGTASKCIVATVKSDFSAVSSTGWLTAPSAFSAAWEVVTNDAGTDVVQFTVPTALNNVAYIRLCCGALTDASIITVNEEID